MEKTERDWKKYMLPGMREDNGVIMLDNDIDDIKVMDIFDDDCWVCSFPRSGTTLTQEMVYLITTLDFATAKSVQLDDRFPIIDYKNKDIPYYRGLKYVQSLERPRMIKCHLHNFLLPDQLRGGKGKIIYIARNPKDVVVSFWRLMVHTGNPYNLEFEEFCQLFVHGRLNSCPWTKHVLQYWNARDEENVLFLKFEDVVKDIKGTIRLISQFLGRVITSDDVDKICEHCQIDNMRSNKMVNWSWFDAYAITNDSPEFGFIYKGMSGGWKEHLSSNISEQIDKMLEEVAAHGLEF